jgi:predicted lipoprotein
MATTRQVATRTQIIQMNRLLEEHVEKLADGLCIYKTDGWSDQRVADELKCPLSSVRGFRVELFGKLKSVAPPETKELAERVEALDGKVEQLETILSNVLQAYENMKDRHNKLVTMLALNHVVDCRHLEVGKGNALKLHQNSRSG